jgi:hypothetical protein
MLRRTTLMSSNSLGKRSSLTLGKLERKLLKKKEI